MAKRQKSYNPFKKRNALAKHLLRNKAVMFITGDEYMSLIDLKTYNKIPITPDLDYALRGCPHLWHTHIAALGKDSQGKPYTKSAIANAPFPVFQDQLTESLNNQHQELLKGMNTNQLYGAAWLAYPDKKDWDEKECLDIFIKHGAFDRYKDPATNDIFLSKEHCDEYRASQMAPSKPVPDSGNPLTC